ncbi:MAG: DNA polymerase III subunit gamma/tau [Thermostichus sp. HHBFW_bins_43]
MAAGGKDVYEPLHLKYRPQRFADVVGQSAVVQTLANAIRLGRIAPAYLFCGPRGTGKTSSARILAKSLNCERGPTADPCQVCSQCRAITGGASLDVIEIDAASNTGVDNIRELIERAQFAPVNSRYKVYVIDECHMLSNAAFNALLKTLEEPPAHVVFVLATTDPQRVLPTVISRCQRFDYRRIPLNDMVAHLGTIAAKEGIPITTDALQLVAQLSQGGLRDAESLLDQLSLLDGSITPEVVWDLVGAIPERHLLELLDALMAQDAQAVLSQARQLLEHGKEPLVLVQNLVAFYRDLLLIKTAPDRRELVALTDPTWEALQQRAPSYSVEKIVAAQSHLRQCEPQIRQSGQPRLWLEIALIDLLWLQHPGRMGVAEQHGMGHPGSETVKATAPVAAVDPAIPEPVPTQPVTPPPPAEPPPKARDPLPQQLPNPVSLLRPRWDEFLKRLSPITKALMGSGHLHQETPEEITLAFPSKGLVEKVRSKEAELRSVLQSLLQRSVRLNLVVQRSTEAVHTTSGRHASAPAAPESSPLTPSHQGAIGVASSGHRVSPTPAKAGQAPAPKAPSSSPNPGSIPVPSPPAGLTAIDELEEIARRFADHFNGSLVDLEGVLGFPEASSLETLEGEGSLELLSGTDPSDEVPASDPFHSPKSVAPGLPEEEELPF